LNPSAEGYSGIDIRKAELTAGRGSVLCWKHGYSKRLMTAKYGNLALSSGRKVLKPMMIFKIVADFGK
jgi:hypothetical protein